MIPVSVSAGAVGRLSIPRICRPNPRDAASSASLEVAAEPSAVAANPQEDRAPRFEASAREDGPTPFAAVPAAPVMVPYAVAEQAEIAPVVLAREEIAAEPGAGSASSPDAFVPTAATWPGVPAAVAEKPTIAQSVPQRPRLNAVGSAKRFSFPIAVAVAMLMLVGTGLGVWRYRQRLGLTRILHPGTAAAAAPATSASHATAETKPPADTPAAQPLSPAQTVPTVPQAKPSEPVSAVSQPQTDIPAPPPHPPIANPPAVTPPMVEAPPTARSGMLHYAGPPVAYGGTVVFSGLLAGRWRLSSTTSPGNR